MFDDPLSGWAPHHTAPMASARRSREKPTKVAPLMVAARTIKSIKNQSLLMPLLRVFVRSFTGFYSFPAPLLEQAA